MDEGRDKQEGKADHEVGKLTETAQSEKLIGRLSVRIDEQTELALNEYILATRGKKTDLVQDAIHRYLMINSASYRRKVEDQMKMIE